MISCCSNPYATQTHQQGVYLTLRLNSPAGCNGQENAFCVTPGGLAIPRRTFAALVASGVVAAGAFDASALSPAIAFADPASEEKKAEALAALEKLDELQSRLDVAGADYGQALMEQEHAQQRMQDAQNRISEATGKISGLQEKLGDRAKSMYRTGSASFLDLLLGATSFKTFANNWDILNTMSEEDAALVKETKELRAKVEEERQVYSEQAAEAQELANKARKVQEDAQALVDEMERTYSELSLEAAELLAEEEAAREEEQRRIVQQQIGDGAAGEGGTGGASNTGGNSGGTASGGGADGDGGASGGSGSGTGGSGASSQSTMPIPNTNVNNSKSQSVPGSLVIERARGEIGKPYVWGACGPDSFDCSGLVSYALSGRYNYRLGTTYTFYYWTRVTDPQPGDVCTSWEHCGIYIGGGRMIHAPNPRKTVQEGSVNSDMIFVRY